MFNKSALLLLFLLLLSGCEKQPSSTHFPLQDGLEWQYQITKTILNEPFTQKAIIRSLKPEVINKQKVYPQVSASGKRYHFFVDEEGVHRYAPNSQTHNWILKYPLQKDTEWTVSTRLFLFDLPKRLEDSMDKLSRDMTMEYKIISMKENIETTAGHFYECMRVDGVGFADIPKRLMLGVRTVKVEDTEWYCPGIGLVKKIRKEFAMPMQYPTEYIQELTAFKQL